MKMSTTQGLEAEFFRAMFGLPLAAEVERYAAERTPFRWLSARGLGHHAFRPLVEALVAV